MLDSFTDTSLMGAFLTGLLAMVSPPGLAIIPAYVASLIGLSFSRCYGVPRRPLNSVVMISSLLFVTGFSLAFMSFGVPSSAIGQWLVDCRVWIRKLGGLFIGCVGVYLLMIQLVRTVPRSMGGYRCITGFRNLGSVLTGVTVAAAWTPCAGLKLGPFLMHVGAVETRLDGMILLMFYSLGISAPLLAISPALVRFLSVVDSDLLSASTAAGCAGILLIAMSVLLYMDGLDYVTAVFERTGVGVS